MPGELDILVAELARRLSSQPTLALANPAQVTVGREGVVEPNATLLLLSVNGMPLRGASWLLTLQCLSPAVAGGPFTGVDFPQVIEPSFRWVFARLRWQIGTAIHNAEIDIPAGGLSLPIACDNLAVEVCNLPALAVQVPPKTTPGPLRFAGSVSLSQGSALATVARRTVGPFVLPPGGNPRQSGIPPFASEVQLQPNSLAAAALNIVLTILDGDGTQVGGQRFVAANAPWAPVDLPTGAAFLELREDGGVAGGQFTLVFRLSLG